MSSDIASILAGWVDKSDQQSARVIQCATGREVLQYYEAQAVMQMELSGRPDGIKPGGYDSMLAQLEAQIAAADNSSPITPQQWMELDREFAQFQQRRRAALLVAANSFMDGGANRASTLYELVVRDVQHCIAILDFAARMHPAHRLISVQPELRPRLLSQRYLALSQVAVMNNRIEKAVETLKIGAQEVRALASTGELAGEDCESAAKDLLMMERAIREKYGVSTTLNEQLQAALAQEDYEKAAALRDRIAHNDAAVAKPVNPIA